MPAPLRSRLTFANVVAVLALSLSLGGVSYAATALPDGSVGTRELARKAVTGSRLAPGSVHKRTLSRGLRRRFATLQQGAQGAVGPAGPQGEAGPGAGRIHYVAAPSTDTTPQTALDYGGLRIRAACVAGEKPGVMEERIYLRSEHDGTLEVVGTDSSEEGEGLEEGEGGEGSSRTSVFKAPLRAGVERMVGGPRSYSRQDHWTMVSGLLVSEGRTVSITMSVDVDAGSETCEIEGTAVAAS